MYIILTYDIRSKRVRKGLKICRKYLTHVQRSVFEGPLTEKQLISLQRELKNSLKASEDSVCIYCMESLRFTSKIEFGISQKNDTIL